MNILQRIILHAGIQILAESVNCKSAHLARETLLKNIKSGMGKWFRLAGREC